MNHILYDNCIRKYFFMLSMSAQGHLVLFPCFHYVDYFLFYVDWIWFLHIFSYQLIIFKVCIFILFRFILFYLWFHLFVSTVLLYSILYWKKIEIWNPFHSQQWQTDFIFWAFLQCLSGSRNLFQKMALGTLYLVICPSMD